ncbi:hypothetical protein BD310DRAFT_358856 [Dichomitus squalens]|uniref:Uncharacterized protein n=1 Tax=Dichomitus squalens TaxID=114155 RepID=A0A4Q9PZE2_9APHY|nr:hypothetical protein BD310DRAFT_358856 [Dichomitus squalens]
MHLSILKTVTPAIVYSSSRAPSRVDICSHHSSARRVRYRGRIRYVDAAFSPSQLVDSKSRHTFGGRFTAHGRLSSTEVIQTITRDQAANGCVVNASAPRPRSSSFQAMHMLKRTPRRHTYSITAVTNPVATETVDPTALARSNGPVCTDASKGYQCLWAVYTPT